MAARILIVTNGPLCRNPRPLKEADALGRAGYDVTVLTVRNHAPSETVDRDILHTAPFRRVTVDMLPGLADNDSTGLVWSRRLWLRLARSAAHHCGMPTMESLGPARALLRRARALPADLVIVHNEVPHWVGARLLAAGRRVAADIEDWHTEDLLPEERRSRPLTQLRSVERQLPHQAAYVSTTSHALADALHLRHGGRPPIVITNSFPLQPAPPRRTSAPPAFFWFSQTLGPGRGLEPFVTAWRMTRVPSRLVLLGQPRPGFVETLLAGLTPAQRAQVELLPLVPPAQLPAVIARHDIGLALEQASILSRDLTITNKILQYLNAGLAIVASDTAGQREVLARSPAAGLLISPDAPVRLAAQLDDLLAYPAALASRQHAARRLAEDTYCWEREEPRLLSAVAGALGA